MVPSAPTKRMVCVAWPSWLLPATQTTKTVGKEAEETLGLKRYCGGKSSLVQKVLES